MLYLQLIRNCSRKVSRKNLNYRLAQLVRAELNSSSVFVLFSKNCTTNHISDHLHPNTKHLALTERSYQDVVCFRNCPYVSQSPQSTVYSKSLLIIVFSLLFIFGTISNTRKNCVCIIFPYGTFFRIPKVLCVSFKRSSAGGEKTRLSFVQHARLLPPVKHDEI